MLALAGVLLLLGAAETAREIADAEPDGNGGRRYRMKRTSQRRPREEWVVIPVPTSPLLTHDLVDLARSTMYANTGSERKHLAREWKLRGVMRCSCGATMQTKTTNPQGRKLYRYYNRVQRNRLRKICECRQQAIRVEDVESVIWEFVSRLFLDPRRIRAGMDQLIYRERATRHGNLEGEARAWSDKLEECVRLRSAYQDQQAAGLMTIEELRSKLANLEQMRRLAEAELVALKDWQHRIEQLEKDRDLRALGLEPCANEDPRDSMRYTVRVAGLQSLSEAHAERIKRRVEESKPGLLRLLFSRWHPDLVAVQREGTA